MLFLIYVCAQAVLGVRIILSFIQFSIKIKSNKGEYVDVAYSIYLCISKYRTRAVVDLMVHPQAWIAGLDSINEKRSRSHEFLSWFYKWLISFYYWEGIMHFYITTRTIIISIFIPKNTWSWHKIITLKSSSQLKQNLTQAILTLSHLVRK